MVEQRMLEQAMFADSLIKTSWAQRSRRSWTTVTSFGLQVVTIAFLLAIPLLRTVRIPSARTVSTPISLGWHSPKPVPLGRSGSASAMPANSVMPRIVLRESRRQPISAPTNEDAPPSQLGIASGIAGHGISGLPDGLSLPIPGNGPAPPPVSSSSNSRIFRTSTMLEGSLFRRVQPVYPPLAKTARIQGQVVLAAIISKAGTIENLQVISGHPMLAKAALEAVSQWRYRPYILNNEPIEVETQIVVNFTLGN